MSRNREHPVATDASLPPAPLGMSEDGRVPKRIEEHLILVMKNRALDHCADDGKAYADCCRGRTVSIVWKCRGKLESYNQCLHKFTNAAILEQLKDDYLASRVLPPVKPRRMSHSSH